MAEGLVQQTDSNWYFLRLKAWVLQDAGKYEASADAYKAALEKLDGAKG